MYDTLKFINSLLRMLNTRKRIRIYIINLPFIIVSVFYLYLFLGFNDHLSLYITLTRFHSLSLALALILSLSLSFSTSCFYLSLSTCFSLLKLIKQVGKIEYFICYFHSFFFSISPFLSTASFLFLNVSIHIILYDVNFKNILILLMNKFCAFRHEQFLPTKTNFAQKKQFWQITRTHHSTSIRW